MPRIIKLFGSTLGFEQEKNDPIISVEDMLHVQSVEGSQDRLNGSGIVKHTVYGDPMHLTASELSRMRVEEEIEAFLLHEARRGIGNYAVISQNDHLTTIITSPGYSGGYVYAKGGHVVVGTVLSSVLGQIPTDIEMDEFGLCFYLNHAPQSNFNHLPFTTFFRYVTRLPPGTYVEIDGGKIKAFYSYLSLSDRLDAPFSFDAAMGEITDALKSYFKRNKKTKAALMFSGGVDCLAIYLALREAIGPQNITLYTMEHSTSNGPARAIPVAKALGTDVHVVTDDVYEDGVISAKVSELMKHDVLGINSPHLAFLNINIKDTVIFHGQNFDALANIHMEILQETQEVGYYSSAGMRLANTDNRAQRQSTAFMKNLQLTDAYLTDEKFQVLTAAFFAGMKKNAKPDPKPGSKGILRGMISHQFPNTLSPAEYPMNQITHLNHEVARFEDFIGFAVSDPRMSLDMIRYLTYTQIANKRATTFPVGENSRPLFLAMSGPITSYFLGKSRTMSDASQPKREIYAYTRKMSGVPYRTLMKGDGKPDARIRDREVNNFDPLLEGKRDMLDPEASRVIRAISDTKIAAHIAKFYTHISNACEVGGNATAYQKQMALRLANLEMIMAEAEKQRAMTMESPMTIFPQENRKKGHS